jgi:hypothetical protein
MAERTQQRGIGLCSRARAGQECVDVGFVEHAPLLDKGDSAKSCDTQVSEPPEAARLRHRMSRANGYLADLKA